MWTHSQIATIFEQFFIFSSLKIFREFQEASQFISFLMRLFCSWTLFWRNVTAARLVWVVALETAGGCFRDSYSSSFWRPRCGSHSSLFPFPSWSPPWLDWDRWSRSYWMDSEWGPWVSMAVPSVDWSLSSVWGASCWFGNCWKSPVGRTISTCSWFRILTIISRYK